MSKRWMLGVIVTALLALAFVAAACDDDDDTDADPTAVPDATEDAPSAGSHSQLLAEVQSRGRLICGVNDSVPGFGFVDPDGNFSGFDIDFCLAIAAAVLGDPSLVDFVPLDATARLTALQTGQIDVLSRNTTLTLSRDVSSGLSYATTTYYDGQGMMVRADSGFTSVDDLADSPICVLQGTTTEQNLATRLPDSEGVGFQDNDTLQEAFIAERCDGWTSDKSQLAGRRSAYPESEGGPEALTILTETFSKEPLGLLTIDNDNQWFDIVNWIVRGIILAEEKGITSANLADHVADPGDVETASLLGVAFEGGEIFDSGLGLDPTFMQAVIAAVGNYGEIYDRNVTPIGIEREGTANELAADGGLLFVPPWK